MVKTTTLIYFTIWQMLMVAGVVHSETLPDTNATKNVGEFEWFPLAAYDRDIGVGLGLKGFYLNAIGKNESSDATVFASTKGERWFRFVFSIPDFEIRHGTRFDYAIDLSIDYDLYLRNSFFGVGMGSNFNNRSYYSKEPLDINLSMSRGFSETYTGRIGVRYKIVNNYNIDKNIYNNPDLSSLKEGKAERYSYFLTFTYDTKDNRLNPKKGYFIEAEWENSPFVKIQNPELKIQNFVLNRFSIEAQYYYYIEFLKTVFASRFKSEWLSNIDLPVQFLLPIGGNNTLRGFPQDRFLDKAYGLVNSELRFPIWCRLGGILGLDMGRVWSSIEEFSFYNWRITPAVGLRFYMDTFIIRLTPVNSLLNPKSALIMNVSI